jgi:protein-S-isoprenylcysteine O-methyltransferase Ste14
LYGSGRGTQADFRIAYRWVRHPFYDAMAFLTVAIALIAANWFLFVAGTVVFVLLAVRTQTEEAQLLARFGDAYRTYRHSTGRFVPRLRQKEKRCQEPLPSSPTLFPCLGARAYFFTRA